MAAPWLAALHHHSVFNAPPEASTSQRGDSTVRRQHLALIRSTELLVAIGQELRIASLSEAKSRADGADGKAGTYKVLRTPLLSFDIDAIVVNPPSKLVAVVGKQRIVVIVLPRKGWTGVIGEQLDCRAIEVGEAQLGPSTIAQVRWHPWSTNAATLLVLTSDGLLREYDVADDAERPAQTIDFLASSPDSQRRPGASYDASFDLDEEEETAVAFALGEGDADWGPLTVYGLMADGTLYSYCPYLPKSAAVPAAYLQSLEVFIHADQSSDAAKQAGRLAAALCDQADDAPKSRDTEHLVAVRLPDDFARLHEQRQGPYLLQPAPRELKGSRGATATDLVWLPTSAGVSVLVTAFSDGKVCIFLDVERPKPRWRSMGTPAALPSLCTYDTLDLGLVSAPRSLLQLHPDPFYPHILHVQHDGGSHLLDLSPWLKPLRDRNDGLQQVVQEQLATDVRWHFATDTQASLAGLQVVNDVYLGSIIVALQLSPLRPIAIELELSDSIPLETASVGSSPSRSAKSSAAAQTAYLSLLPPTAFAPRPIKLHRQQTANQGVSTESLKSLGTIVTAVRSDIRDIVNATNEAQERLALQLKELPRQLARLAELRRQLAAFGATADGPDRLTSAAERQRTLLARTDRLLQRLMDAYRPGVSDAERAWFAELARMRGEVERGAARRVAKVQEMVTQVRPRAAVLQVEAEAEGRMGSRQVQAVESQLLIESRLIDTARARVEGLQDRMTKLAIAI